MGSVTRTKRYLKAFSLASALAGVLFGLAMALKFGLWSGIIAGILAALSWGILMALVLIPFDLYHTRDISVEALGVHQARELHVKGNIEDVFARCVGSLRELKFFKSVTPFELERSIAAKTKATWASFGESVTLRFENALPGVVKIQITSQPVYRLTLLDYGKNYRNAEAITQAIRARFATNE